MRALRGILGVLLLASPGCASTASLTVQTIRPGDTIESAISQKQALPDGAPLSLTIKADRPVHVYALLLSAQKPPRILFPAESDIDIKIRPGRSLHLPREGFYQVEGPAGPQEIIVVASRTPIKKNGLPTRVPSGPITGDEERSRDAQPEPPPPPPTTTNGRGDTVHVSIGPDGVAVLRFRFRNRGF